MQDDGQRRDADRGPTARGDAGGKSRRDEPRPARDPRRAADAAREAVSHRLLPRRKPDWGPVPVAEIIGDALRQCGLGDRVERQEAIQAWPRMVGEKIARHSRALDLDDGVLVLDADHGVWRQELTLLMPLIKERYNREFGPDTVTEIRWHRRWERRRGKTSRKE